MTQYRQEFPGAETRIPAITAALSARVSGDKNPGFNHGGKFSPFSKNFKNGDISGETTKKANETKAKNQSYTSRLDYWLKKTGMDGARQSDGSLPVLSFFKLASSSKPEYHAGIAISGLTTDGVGNSWYSTPSLGCYEFGGNTIPTVTTTAITAITTTTATSGGNVTSDGGAAVIARGVCFGLSSNPTLSGSHTSDGTGTGSFASSITGRTANTTYHVRAYATNSVGTAYGSDVQFTTTGGNTILTINGETVNDGTTGDWSGRIIPRSVPTTLTYTNNSITSVNTSGYILQAGDESPGSTNNNLDGEIITGNKLTWNGTPGTPITHGVFLGYNINCLVKYNYLDKVPYGILPKSGQSGVSNMSYTSGGIAYNIVKDAKYCANSKGMDGVCYYNNTFYDHIYNGYALLDIYRNDSYSGTLGAANIKIKNNIFYTKYVKPAIWIEQTESLSTLQSDYNVFYCEDGNVLFRTGNDWEDYNQQDYTFAQWQALGFDTHSVVVNPNFINTTDFVPTSRLDYGTNLGSTWQTGLSTSAVWTVGISPATTDQNGSWQVGARVYAGGTTIPTLTTTSITNITVTTATSGGNISSDGGATVTVRGICWGISLNPTTALSTKTSNGTGTGSFPSSITGLTGNTIYHVRSYATNSSGTAYGDDVSFESAHIIPAVTTTAISSITTSTAVSGGNVLLQGGEDVTAKGVCWSASVNPTIADSKTTDGTGLGSFVSSITGLTASTTYHVRAYASNSIGTAYGSDVSFASAPIIPIVPTVPTVTTTIITDITQTTATSGGNVTYDGGASVTSKGVCWDHSGYPALDNVHTSDGIGTGIFVSFITGLTPGTTYYVKAYAINSQGTSYGSTVTFTTSSFAPTVTTTAITGITTTAAISGGNVTSDGGGSVTAYGVCWGISSNPTTAGIHTTDGSGTGSYTSSITGLSANTVYHVRAYASNSVGTSYGADVQFTSAAITSITPVTHNGVPVTSGGKILVIIR